MEFENGVSIAPMSFYKILEEIDDISRFQLAQKSYNRLELRIVATDRNSGFEKANNKLSAFLKEKGVFLVEIALSPEAPQTNKVSGKFKHVYKDFD